MAQRHEYLVKTLFLANFIEAAQKVAQERRTPTDIETLKNALKRLDMADRLLAQELNTYGMGGYQLVDTMRYPVTDQPGDLLITAIFSRIVIEDEKDEKTSSPLSPDL